MAIRNVIGEMGEEAARAFLLTKGYVIRDSNWRFGHYELDIVAQKDGEIVFVEVKTRTEDYLQPFEDTINDGKIRRIVSAADAYLQNRTIDLPVRFDVIFITLLHDGKMNIEHLEDAFVPPVYKGKHWS